MGPFPESENGHRYILVAVDHFTKWSEAYPLPNQEAPTVARVLANEWFFRYSPPETLHSDQGQEFESQLVQELCRILQIKKSRTSPYHPQCDGTAERFNRTLLNMLATTTKGNPHTWEDFLRPLCMAYNSSTHLSTGFTPFYLMFGREARLPIDLNFGTGDQEAISPVVYVKQLQQSLDYAYTIVRDTLGHVQKRQKTLYDKKVHGNPFNVGDNVWLFSSVVPTDGHRKLHHPWTGPYTVLQKLSDVNYKIQHVNKPEKVLVVHFMIRLKICPPGTRLLTAQSDASDTIDTRQQHNVGDGAELLDMDEVDGEPRYPHRHRRPPDRLHPFVNH